MKPINTINDGYILVMTLLIIALATLMTTIMFNRGSSYIPYVHTVIDRQKSIMLAFGGLALAESQLLHSIVATEQKKQGEEQKKPEKPTEVQETQQLLRTILPTLNQWQTFTLSEDHDGVEGVLQLCVMSEEGKINLNKAYDFKTKKFKDEAQQGGGIKAALTPIFIEIEKMLHTKNLLQSLEQFLQKRGYPLNDVTELLTIKGFEAFKHAVYYAPAATTKTKEKETKRICDLTDLFTLNSGEVNADPWLLSESLRTLLNIPPSVASSDPKHAETVAEILKQFKLKAQWQNEWDTFLKPLYGIEFSRLPKYASMVLRTQCKPCYFSVLIHSTVGDVTERLYVILERIQKSQDTKTVYKIVVRSYYWL
jgi:hypothetical protein